MERILIAGATGHTGKRVIEILSNTQHFNPIAMIRKESQKQIFDDMEVESVLADLEQDIDHAVKGIDRLIFVAGSGSKTGPDKTLSVDLEGAKKMVDAAKKHKVKKFIMISAMGTEDPSKNKKLEHYLRAKKEADDYLIDSGIPYTIIKPGVLTQDLGLAKVKIAPKLEERGEISRDDVAFLIVMCLADPLAKNMTFEAIEGEDPIKSALIELSRNN